MLRGERPEGKRVDGSDLDELQGPLLSVFLAGPTQILAWGLLHTKPGAWCPGPGRRWRSSLACRHSPGGEEGRIGFVIRQSLDLNLCSLFITQIKVFVFLSLSFLICEMETARSISQGE